MKLDEDHNDVEDPNTWRFCVGGDEDDRDYIEVKKYVSPQFHEYRYAILTHYGNARGFLGNNYTLEEVNAYLSLLPED